MRHLLFLCALLAGFGAAAEEAITFDGKRYALAQVTGQGPDVTNQYLPAGESAANWQTSLAVRLFKGSASVEQVSAGYVKGLGRTLMDDPQTLAREGAKEDIVLVMFLTTADKDVYEYNLQRFVRTKEGVASYRFAQRFPKEAPLPAVIQLQAKRIEQLFALNVPVKSAM